MRPLSVAPAEAGLRLDVFLSRRLPGCSRRRAQRAIAAGAVRVNGRRARKGTDVGAGDLVEVTDAVCAEPALQPNPNLVVPVLFADAAVVALDKPAGLPSHALRDTETDTVANFLLARYPETAALGRCWREPGIVHRLDTDTSGVLLAARTPAAYAHLRRQFVAHAVIKEYLAVVHGDIAAPGEVRTAVAHDRTDRRRMRVSATEADHARPAFTAYRPLERFGQATLLAVRITTGVRHQIRVHLASIGHRVVGDRLYGPPAAPDDPQRQLLHACRLGFRHPLTAVPVEIHSPTPADLGTYLERLRFRSRARPESGRPNRRR